MQSTQKQKTTTNILYQLLQSNALFYHQHTQKKSDCKFHNLIIIEQHFRCTHNAKKKENVHISTICRFTFF